MVRDISIRKLIVEEALTWIGTPFHDKEAKKGAGVDCAYFPYAVYDSLSLLPPDVPIPDYAVQFWAHRGDEIYIDTLVRLGLREVDRHHAGPGDVVVSKFGRVFAHGAILLNFPEIVHANPDQHRVTKARIGMHRLYIDRPIKYYTIFETKEPVR